MPVSYAELWARTWPRSGLWLTRGCSWPSGDPEGDMALGQGWWSVAAGSSPATGWPLSGPPGCWTGGSWQPGTGSAGLDPDQQVASGGRCSWTFHRFFADKAKDNQQPIQRLRFSTYLLVWLRCLRIRLGGRLHGRVHRGGGTMGRWGVLVPGREGGVVSEVATWWQTSWQKKGKTQRMHSNDATAVHGF